MRQSLVYGTPLSAACARNVDWRDECASAMTATAVTRRLRVNRFIGYYSLECAGNFREGGPRPHYKHMPNCFRYRDEEFRCLRGSDVAKEVGKSEMGDAL